jgi:hypothetical protein
MRVPAGTSRTVWSPDRTDVSPTQPAFRREARRKCGGSRPPPLVVMSTGETRAVATAERSLTLVSAPWLPVRWYRSRCELGPDGVACSDRRT